MKKIHIFLFATVSCLQIFAQDSCVDADSNLIYAYSNVKDAYDSDNLDHLKYYSKKSLNSFKKAKINLEKCGCDKAYNLAYDGAELLAKVESQDTFEDGRFYVKRAKEIAQNSITALNEFVAQNDVAVNDDGNDELNALQVERERLEQQQKALKQKEAAIAKKLAEQKTQQLVAQKKQLISSFEIVVSDNIKTYNKSLDACNCSDSKIEPDVMSTEALLEKSIAEIKQSYSKKLKSLASNYISELSDCD
ncbi:AAA family ATPase [Seonamhaeicola marinus]|uniref:DUF4398 domain-containing protein n=1 Tax=Seonamhaeicola marinus TaxID=1912246 RepID=A0A5D0H4T3_9FLAO|nr:hypothetical protein [Seonamhaeicola marinus]TYA65990.1 hypothetical protein FUA24_24215 [Seonamhaeicola marinus]